MLKKYMKYILLLLTITLLSVACTNREDDTKLTLQTETIEQTQTTTQIPSAVSETSVTVDKVPEENKDIIETTFSHIQRILEEDIEVVKGSISWSEDEEVVLYIRKIESTDESAEPEVLCIWKVGEEERYIEETKGFISDIIMSPDENFVFVRKGIDHLKEGLVIDTRTSEAVSDLGYLIYEVAWTQDSNYLGFSGVEFINEEGIYLQVDTKVFNVKTKDAYPVLIGEEWIEETEAVSSQTGIEAVFDNWNEKGMVAKIKYLSGEEELLISYDDIELGIANTVRNVNFLEALYSLYGFENVKINENNTYAAITEGHSNLKNLLIMDMTEKESFDTINAITSEVHWIDDWLIFTTINNNYILPEVEIEYGNDVILYELSTKNAYMIFEGDDKSKIFVHDVFEDVIKIGRHQLDSDDIFTTLYLWDELLKKVSEEVLYKPEELVYNIPEIYNLGEEIVSMDESIDVMIKRPYITFMNSYVEEKFNKAMQQIITSGLDYVKGNEGENITHIQGDYELALVKKEYISVFLKFEYYSDNTIVDSFSDSYTISIKDGYAPNVFDFFTAEEHENVIANLLMDKIQANDIELSTEFVPLSDVVKYYLTDTGIMFYYPLNLYHDNGHVLQIELNYSELEGVIDIEQLPRF